MWKKNAKIGRNDKESDRRGSVSLCVRNHLRDQHKCSPGPNLSPGLEFDMSVLNTSILT